MTLAGEIAANRSQGYPTLTFASAHIARNGAHHLGHGPLRVQAAHPGKLGALLATPRLLRVDGEPRGLPL